MGGDYDGEIFDRLRDLEISRGRTEEWKGGLMERVKKTEDALDGIQKTLIRSEVRLSVIIGVLIFLANWLFRHL